MTYEWEEIFSPANLELLFKRQIPITTGKKNKRGARGLKRTKYQRQSVRTQATDNALCKEEVEEVRRG